MCSGKISSNQQKKSGKRNKSDQFPCPPLSPPISAPTPNILSQLRKERKSLVYF